MKEEYEKEDFDYTKVTTLLIILFWECVFIVPFEAIALERWRAY